MSKKLSRSDALESISTWSINDVLYLLQKNGLEECCKAITKRQINGEELLHLTEGKLALWKSDLTRPLIWSLSSFVDKVKQSPEKYVEEQLLWSREKQDNISDNGSWGSDTDDEINEDNVDENKKAEIRTSDALTPQGNDEMTYANCGPIQGDASTYANLQEPQNVPVKNISKLHSQFGKSLVEQLQEQLKLMNAMKSEAAPKPEALPPRKTEKIYPEKSQPQKSFLHNISKTKTSVPSQMQKRMMVPPPPEPKRQKEQNQSTKIEKSNKEIPKPPAIIRNLDLVANLPTRTEESGDEYEAFDEQIIEQNQKKNISRISSKQSLMSGYQSSVESIYRSPSVTSQEWGEEQYEIYESITEPPDESGYYLSPIQRTPNSEPPPPLPAKPSQSSTTASPNLNRSRPEKPAERSPEKKSATLPHASSNSSLSTERATRPLPPPPDRQPYTEKPWFHNVTREQATALIKEQNIYGNPQDGYFLLRPSTTNVNNPLALVLWYKDRVYNLPVRKRLDNKPSKKS